ncbi:MAG: hypothetical protein JNM43_06955, partial [Planctomycetaceae bacterium]|nr:hypothetical protein [Planctomycetaceae bacterium]
MWHRPLSDSVSSARRGTEIEASDQCERTSSRHSDNITSRKMWRSWLSFMLLCLLPCSSVIAQSSSKAQTHALEIEILIQPLPSYRVKAQEWGRVFQDIGYTPRFREANRGEKLRVEQREENEQQVIHLIGGLSNDGTLKLKGQDFTTADGEKLSTLLGQLKAHGLEGPPRSNPTWGLSEEEFQKLTTTFSEPVDKVIDLSSPAVTLNAIGMPEGMKVRFTDAAYEISLRDRPAAAPKTLDLTGFSKGTAMAIVLSQYGLGFRPVVNRKGVVDLEVDAGNETSNLWPIGWKTKEATVDVLPAWLKAIPIETEEAELSTLLNAVAEKLGVPLFVSTQALASEQIDLEKILYTR